MASDHAPAHGEAPHGGPAAHHIPYFATFAALIALTVVTVLAYYVLLWGGLRNEVVRVLIALVIASAKASLVAAFFMHLKFEGRMIHIILYVPLALCVLLVVALIPDIMHGTLFNDPPYQDAHPLPDGVIAPVDAQDVPAH